MFKNKVLIILTSILIILLALWFFQRSKTPNIKNTENFKTYYTRTDIINKLIKDNGLKTYLEIGLNNPYRNFVEIKAKQKYSVDPYDNNDDLNTEENIKNWLKFCTHRMTSDEFFKQNNQKFDIIFIDGLHKEKQVDKDIYNSLKVLNNGGYIVVHDCIPFNESAQIEDRPKNDASAWNGTVWKAFVKISQLDDKNIETFVINTDFGVGVIHKLGDVKYELPKPLKMSYKKFEKDINVLYKIVEPEDFFENEK